MSYSSPTSVGGAQGANVMSTLKQKMQSLRDELDKYRDMYEDKCKEVEREKCRRSEYENEAQSFQRRVRLLEEENDQLESRLHTTVQKLQEAAKVIDEHERARRMMENKQGTDEERVLSLEDMLRTSRAAANEAERKYEEAARRLLITEKDLERAEERSEAAEAKARHLDTDLHLITNSLKSVEISEQTLAHREETYESTISELSARLREAEHAVDMLSRELKCKQADLDQSEENFSVMQLKYKAIRDEMDSYLHDLSSI